MRVEVITAESDIKLERKVNKRLEQEALFVKDVKFSVCTCRPVLYAAMIILHQ